MLFCESFKEKSRKVFLTTITLPFSDKVSNYTDNLARHVCKRNVPRWQSSRVSLAKFTCDVGKVHV